MKLAPLGDKVVLKQVEAQETTKSGIVLTSQAKEKPQEAIVVAVGPGGVVGDTKIEMVVKEGDHVEENQTLMTIEAMKMETAISARMSGTVEKILISKGDTVKGGQLLLTIK